MERHVIIGTAGHIDHGKTTLIKALTGRDTDRLKEEKAMVCADRWNQEGASVQIQVEKCISKAGGGALPETEIPSYGVALESTEITVEELESRMRNLSVPVIGRIKEGRFLLDMRTFSEEGIEYLATQIRHVMERKHN